MSSNKKQKTESKTGDFDFKAARAIADKDWDNGVYETLCEYIKIPNLSPAYDKDCLTNGLADKAVDLLVNWVKKQQVPGLEVEVVTEPGRTPLIYMVLAGSEQDAETVMMYGHMDKQPHMLPWAEGLGPCDPVLRDGKLYGRGGADDGYAIFSCITALKILQTQQLKRPRVVMLIEASEESGSPDLPFYIDKLESQIGSPSLIICLDSGCGNYEQLWLTTSLRGVLSAHLKVEVLTEGVHSGLASGIVPSSFRIMRQLLDRLEDKDTGKVLLKTIQPDIPPKHFGNADKAAAVLKEEILQAYPFVEGMASMAATPAAALLQKAWHPTLSYTGVSGVPDCSVAGNVLRPHTTLALSFRLPPTVNPEEVGKELVEVVEANPPYNAKVSCSLHGMGSGWKAPELAPWLEEAVERASQGAFGKGALLWGEGGSIPFMGMLGKKFPRAQFVITGVLGPKSNAHGPNEFLHVNTMHCVTLASAYVLSQVVHNPQTGSTSTEKGGEFMVGKKDTCCV
mmetsp:Transcript_28676/g.56338  ORF Transcript_28676/g.56338 Transcript_28676/m.56338 type:complete len:510 (+) Transcript_28676:31-1560(+)|eukprot:CAMPEP_0175140972 /NCGR_PEP_ID=MMETSP0087-20121206/11820_1 /TAXON_ID=136419 /ORGANISM="Unknown Unknown, Strain D1" /LENGTH=509 /DNA_ID=CAMNT_0016424283 /DNA_START=33 /DNA_END=1562 /DNA_ORIENTATION=-